MSGDPDDATGPQRGPVLAERPRDAAPDRPGPPVDVSVIVVNWNTRDDLRRCLESVHRETSDVSFEVVVVDNASADGSQAMVLSEFPSVALIANPENRGFAAANNQGLRISRGRYALLLNPDTTVLDGAIGKTVRIADADPGVGALGCQVLLRAEGDPSTAVQPTCFRFPSLLHTLLTWFGLDRLVPASWLGGGPTMKDWDRTSARDVDVVSGMYLLVRRSAFERVGLMDEAYFVYAEEADWCFRLWRAGWRCAFTPDARIVHHEGGGRSTSQVRAKMYVQLQKSMLIFHRKNLGLPSWLAAKAAYVIAMAVRTFWFGLASAVLPAARPRARCAAAALLFHLTGIEPKR